MQRMWLCDCHLTSLIPFIDKSQLKAQQSKAFDVDGVRIVISDLLRARQANREQGITVLTTAVMSNLLITWHRLRDFFLFVSTEHCYEDSWVEWIRSLERLRFIKPILWSCLPFIQAKSSEQNRAARATREGANLLSSTIQRSALKTI